MSNKFTVRTGSGDESSLRSITPKLVQNGSTFQPKVVTRLGGTLPWNTESTNLQCGDTIVESDEDFNIRINMECVASHTEFVQLVDMRQQPERVRLISAAYTGPVTFDELAFERVTDANGQVTPAGPDEEPLYNIQLQSKENSESNSE